MSVLTSEGAGSTIFDATADGKKFLINSANQKEGNEPVTLVQNCPAEKK